MNWIDHLQYILDGSFFLVFVAFAAGAFFFFLERDRVPEDYRLAVRVSTIYLTIAAVNYYYMMDSYAAGDGYFPTSFRYIDWILTTPLMLIKFPLLLGIGPKGVKFMTRLVVLDLIMIGTGFVGEIVPGVAAVHYGMFLLGCIAWLLIVVSMVQALGELPDRLGPAARKAVRTMSMFIVIGWAIYPLGYLAPLMEVPFEVRELIYNVGDLGNKVGLCLVVYFAAKRTMVERAEEADVPSRPPAEYYEPNTPAVVPDYYRSEPPRAAAEATGDWVPDA
ncbi:MAG: bacteriorhodopsin [Myxococcota bacterium]